MSPSGEICLERGNFMVRTRRSLTALALFAALLLAPALAGARPAAAPRSHAGVHATTTGAGADLLGRLWKSLRSLWGKEGMLIDPNGAHVPGATGTTATTPGGAATSDAGMLIDPNG
jgi:hypothetical protein